MAAALTATSATSADATADMEFEGTITNAGMEPTETTVVLNHEGGRTLAIVAGEEAAPTDNDGWITAGRKLQRRHAEEPAGKPVLTPAASQPKSNSRFARQVTARISKAARMPVSLPKEEIKIIVRPRGGLHVARTEATRLMTAIITAAGITMQESKIDTICTNPTQNIIIVSTPSEDRARKYVQVKRLQIGNVEYETFAYVSAPNGTAKGVIRGIDLSETHQDLQDNIVNEANPLALEAHRIGNTTTIIVAFEGTKVPNTVKYGAMIVRCSLYRQHHEVCRCCGKLGHRADVCPYPETKVCFACGKPNPDQAHEATCKPRCKLCNGAHPTGATGCRNRYKMPHVVTQRRWEKEQQRSVTKKQMPQPTVENFPHLQPKARENTQRANVSADVRAAAGNGVESNKNSQATPCTGNTWATVANGTTAPRSNNNASDPRVRQLEAELQQMRGENSRLRERMAEQDSLIQELNRKVEMLLIGEHRQMPQPQAFQTLPPPRTALPEPIVEALPKHSPTPTYTTTEDSSPEEIIEDMSEPRAKRRALKAKKRALRRINERSTWQDEDSDKQAESINKRLSTIEATMADMVVKFTNLEARAPSSNMEARFASMEKVLNLIEKNLMAPQQRTTSQP